MTDTLTIVLTIIGTGIALASVILTGQRAMHREIGAIQERISQLETDLRERISQLETDLRERISRLEADLRERMGRLEGLFEGSNRSKSESEPGPTQDP